MGLGFVFTEPVNPKSPLDPEDPPPVGWYNGIDTHDYRKALFGFRSPTFQACRDWEERELERYRLLAGTT